MADVKLIEFDETIFRLPSCQTLHAHLHPQLSQWPSDEYVQHLRQLPHTHLCGFVRDDPTERRVIALAMYRIYLNTFDTVRFEVDDLIVAENERNQGFATRLVQHLIDQAKRGGGERILVHCDVSNTSAHRLLFRLGFSITVFQFVTDQTQSLPLPSSAELQVIDVTDENDETMWKDIQRVHRQLRPHLSEDFPTYCQQIRDICQSGPARLIVTQHRQEKTVLGLAVYRHTHRLQYSNYMYSYVDDLVTDEEQRSTGVGRSLLNYVKNEAEQSGIAKVLLDSGCQRGRAHRFYYRENFQLDQFGFALIF